MIASESQVPTFAVFKDNKKVETLLHCYIKETRVTIRDYHNLHNTTINGVTYKVVWDEATVKELEKMGSLDSMEVAISMQKHTYGAFAVIKKSRPRKTP